MTPSPLVLFIDAQNFYNSARRAFFSGVDPHIFGQFNPVKLGQLIASRPVGGEVRRLKEVRIYTGRPSSSKEPKTYSANRRQCAAWERLGATVIWRTLRYPHEWPRLPPQQKGIDVALAIDFIAMAIDSEYEVGVIASGDTDLLPALEFVHKRYTDLRVEVAAWKGETGSQRLRIPGTNIFCHWLDKDNYEYVSDLRDYRT